VQGVPEQRRRIVRSAVTIWFHGGMHIGFRDEAGTRLYTEQQFKNGVQPRLMERSIATKRLVVELR